MESSQWYEQSVQEAYELGLMSGDPSGTFRPTGQVTLAETVTVAARIHSLATTGAENFTQGEPWYQVYVDYALQNGMLTVEPADYSKAATRLEFAQILSKALPAEDLTAINQVADGAIPDVADDQSVYLLYRAGVLTGSDKQGTFLPDSTIQRCEVAAIVTRMALPELRQLVSLGGESGLLQNDNEKPANDDNRVVIRDDAEGEDDEEVVDKEQGDVFAEPSYVDENNALTKPFDEVYPDLHNGIRKAEISGSVTDQTMALTLAAGDVVTVRYSKDVSVSRDQDQGWVTLDYELVTGMGRVEVSVDSLEPDCTGAIVCDDCGTVVKAALGHLDANKDHICDRHCGETNMELHQAAPNGHICEYCGVVITTCADYNNDGLCDTCGSDMGKTYSVIFVVEAGSPTPAVQTVYHGALIGKPIDPVRENYIFAGWTTNAEGNNFWDFGTDRVTEEITLYAQWTRHQWKPAQYVWCANGCTEILSCANCDTTVETPIMFALAGKIFTMSRVPDGLRLLFACYENDGRMVECQMETAAKRIELSIEKNAAEGSCLYVFFLGANWEPLCIQLKY